MSDLSEIYVAPHQVREAYNYLLKKLGKQTQDLTDFDCVVAPLNGGFWVGHQLSKEIKKPFIPIRLSMERKEFDDLSDLKGKRVLFCDDIYDTGETVQWFIDNTECEQVVCACLFSKQAYRGILNSRNGKKIANLHGIYVYPTDYLVFPWEPEFRKIVDEDKDFKSLRENLFRKE